MRSNRLLATCLICLMWHRSASCAEFAAAAEADLVVADFEGETYGDWVVTGDAFGSGPASGALPGQMSVEGFAGKRLVNSFFHGDGSTGRLTSPEFVIERRYLRFLIGGGGWEDKTCLNLVVDGRVVRSALGPNTISGGSERLEPAGWDVAEWIGKRARLVIVDEATGGWGHINIDHIEQTNNRPPIERIQPERTIAATMDYLLLPIKNGGKLRRASLSDRDNRLRQFDIELADGEADWWAFLDLRAWRGKELIFRVDKLPDGSRALESIRLSETPITSSDLYRESLRPQFHFSPRRGWNNDPNGLVFYGGVYHLFFQHNPYGWNWGNMHWGHATSRDLVHWTEGDEALYPDEMGPMFSGSAVVDWQNSSGLGAGDKPPIVLIYTAAGNPTVQCLASSSDGGQSWSKFAGNPILKEITPGNRDPKVIWHAPTNRWIMTLYVEPDTVHTIKFFSSTNLKEWTYLSGVPSLFECPDFFELPIDNDANRKRWVLTAASSEYFVGTFDGAAFHPETPKLPGHRGRGFYAAQTFSDIPATDGRRIQIGWLQAASPGMSFNQAMTAPLELGLRQTAEGPRLTWRPVKEIESLRGVAQRASSAIVSPGGAALRAGGGELLDVEAVFEPTTDAEFELSLRGVPIRYNALQAELTMGDAAARIPLAGGRLSLRALVDRTTIELFADDGLVYMPLPVLPDAKERSVSLRATRGEVKINRLDVFELRSIWPGAE